MRRTCLVAAVAAAFMTMSAAQAQTLIIAGGDEGPARVKYRAIDPYRPTAALIKEKAPIVAPAAVVRRELAEQPVWPHLAKVKIGRIVTYVDPEADYRNRDERRGIDEDHTIIKAQRRHAITPNQPARVVYGLDADLSDVPQQSAVPMIRIQRPEIDGPKTNPQPIEIKPAVPQPKVADANGEVNKLETVEVSAEATDELTVEETAGEDVAKDSAAVAETKAGSADATVEG